MGKRHSHHNIQLSPRMFDACKTMRGSHKHVRVYEVCMQMLQEHNIAHCEFGVRTLPVLSFVKNTLHTEWTPIANMPG